MIQTISQLLTALRDKGVKQIEPFLNLQHGPTIGSMYEGLTKEIVNQALFEDMDLRVVSGKITNQNGAMSRQIDCMVVVGEGEKIPYTNEFLYDINRVVMVIEVKKNLYSTDLMDGYENLKSVVQVQEPTRDLPWAPIEHAFRQIAGKPLSAPEAVSSLPIRDQMLYHSLIVDSLLPLRVIFGYSGFKSEDTLRQKFMEYLNQNASGDGTRIKGYGPTSLPSLIIAGEFSLVKTNGMPYILSSPELEDFIWYASYRRRPLILFLEILWTRLTEFYNLPVSIFGGDLQNEGLYPFFTASFDARRKGWQYTVIPIQRMNPETADQDTEWEPSFVTKEEHILLVMLCEGDMTTIDEFTDYIGSREEADSILRHLSEERLIYTENGEVRLLTEYCECVILPDGRYCAAENADGRLTRWLLNRYGHYKPE